MCPLVFSVGSYLSSDINIGLICALVVSKNIKNVRYNGPVSSEKNVSTLV